MKSSVGVLLVAATLGLTANGDGLYCTSTKEENIYFSTGQVKIRAGIESSTFLSDFELAVSGGSKLGGSDDSKGEVKGNWVRFGFSDAWCDYTATLPKDFTSRKAVPMFVDARCEQHFDSSFRLNCKIVG